MDLRFFVAHFHFMEKERSYYETDVYSHILDDDRKKNAELFEDVFYGKKEADPQMHRKKSENTLKVPDGVDAELLAKVLSNPEMAALLASLAKTLN